MALGFARDERSDFGRKIIRRESRIQVGADVLVWQRFERELLTYGDGPTIPVNRCVADAC